MPISADQTAVLEMLLVGGQDFSDLDDLFALDEGESRRRARAALEELGGRDPDENVALTDYLLGQADPIDRADAVRHLKQDASDHALAEKITAELAQHFPGAELPSLPQPTATKAMRGGPRRVSPGPRWAGQPRSEQSEGGGARAQRLSRWASGLDQGRARLIAALGAGAIVLIVIVLAVAGAFGSGDDTGSPSADVGDQGDASSPLPDGQEVTRIALLPEGNGDAAGAAIVGITTNDQPYLDLVIENLEPAPQNQAYIVWFMFNKNTGYPIPNPIVPGRDGSYEDRVPIPVEVSGAIARASAVEVSLSPADGLARAIQAAIQANDIAIKRPGRTVMRGDVPTPEDAGSGDQQAPGEGGG